MPWLPSSVGLRGEFFTCTGTLQLPKGANPEKVRHFHSVETNLRISPSTALRSAVNPYPLAFHLFPPLITALRP